MSKTSQQPRVLLRPGRLAGVATGLEASLPVFALATSSDRMAYPCDMRSAVCLSGTTEPMHWSPYL
jgi:hypothetical protein